MRSNVTFGHGKVQHSSIVLHSQEWAVALPGGQPRTRLYHIHLPPISRFIWYRSLKPSSNRHFVCAWNRQRIDMTWSGQSQFHLYSDPSYFLFLFSPLSLTNLNFTWKFSAVTNNIFRLCGEEPKQEGHNSMRSSPDTSAPATVNCEHPKHPKELQIFSRETKHAWVRSDLTKKRTPWKWLLTNSALSHRNKNTSGIKKSMNQIREVVTRAMKTAGKNNMKHRRWKWLSGNYSCSSLVFLFIFSKKLVQRITVDI